MSSGKADTPRAEAPQSIGSPLLRGLPHGFFTRRGGVSTGLYASLNAGQGSADATEAVAENRRRIALALEEQGAREGPLVSVAQIHSPRVVTVTGDWPGPRPEADAMVTDRPGVALGVLVADCAPVLFADAGRGVIGAAHAGWKGALGGVLEATIGAMTTLGARRNAIMAAIGPCISQAAYEVGPEFVETFLDDDRDNGRFFAGGSGDRAHFDLPGYVMQRLRAAGIADTAWTGHCTYSDENRFFSYRRATHLGEPDYGRLIGAIALPDHEARNRDGGRSRSATALSPVATGAAALALGGLGAAATAAIGAADPDAGGPSPWIEEGEIRWRKFLGEDAEPLFGLIRLRIDTAAAPARATLIYNDQRRRTLPAGATPPAGDALERFATALQRLGVDIERV